MADSSYFTFFYISPPAFFLSLSPLDIALFRLSGQKYTRRVDISDGPVDVISKFHVYISLLYLNQLTPTTSTSPHLTLPSPSVHLASSTNPSNMTFRLPPPSSFHYDIDDVLNPYIPKSQVHRLPRPIARFLGHQSPGPQNQEQQPQQHREVGNLLICIWSFVGSFLGLLLVAGVFKSPGIQTYHPPVLLASFVSGPFFLTPPLLAFFGLGFSRLGIWRMVGLV